MLEDFRVAHSQGNDAGKLVLRLAVGILLLLHGMAKLQTPEIIDAMAPSLEALQLPAQTAWFALVGEVFAPLLLIAGVFSRFAGIVVAVQMALVMLLGHFSSVAAFQPMGGYALELQSLYLFAGVAIACLGSGIYALVQD